MPIIIYIDIIYVAYPSVIYRIFHVHLYTVCHIIMLHWFYYIPDDGLCLSVQIYALTCSWVHILLAKVCCGDTRRSVGGVGHTCLLGVWICAVWWISIYLIIIIIGIYIFVRAASLSVRIKSIFCIHTIIYYVRCYINIIMYFNVYYTLYSFFIHPIIFTIILLISLLIPNKACQKSNKWYKNIHPILIFTNISPPPIFILIF